MRYLKATLLIGFVSTLVVLILVATGWISNTPDGMLQKAFGLDGSAPSPGFWALLAIYGPAAFLVAWTTVDITRPALKLIVAATAIVLFLTMAGTAALYGAYVSPIPPIVAILLSYGLGLAYSRSGGGARKRIIERLFLNRVSKHDFSRLLDAPGEGAFPGQLFEASILVCEVRNHRELIELLTPEDYASMTNLYLQTACDYLVEVGGYLEECSGESLRVVFGAPVPDEEHAVKACRASVDLMARLDLLNKECDATWQRRFEFQVGINSGEVIGASYGGSRLANYSIAGPAVEFARRLCVACSTYGCRILVGPETFDMANELFEARPIEVLKGMGDRRRLELYEILSPKNGLSPERERSRDHFWRGVLYYRERKWDKALEEFQSARITGIPDPVLDFYARRVERERRGEPESLKAAVLLEAT